MRIFALVIALLIILPFTQLTAHSYSKLSGELDMDYYGKFKGKGMSINVFNWGEYISNGADGTLDVNKAFEEVTGIKVVYSTYDTNESLYAKLKLGGSDYDIIIPSDYMIARMIEENMLLPINAGNIPNLKYIDKRFRNTSYDPENLYSVPYSWGTVGLIYNTELIDPNDAIDSWSIMWSESYRDNILMFGNPKDAFAIAFKTLGYPINAESVEQIAAATELLKKQKPLLSAYVMDEIFDKMTAGEAALAPYYAGDALTMISENPALSFVVPKEGSNIFIDAICIPYTSQKQELAEMYINFMLEPEVGLANIEFLGYSTANTAVFDLLDEDIKNSPIAYPDEETLANCEFFHHIDDSLLKVMDEKWTEILASDEQYNRLLMPIILLICIVFSIGINLARAIKKAKLAGYTASR